MFLALRKRHPARNAGSSPNASGPEERSLQLRTPSVRCCEPRGLGVDCENLKLTIDSMMNQRCRVYCTGCFTCEVACQQENGFPVEKYGIKVTVDIYVAINKPVAIDHLPFPTDLSNLCATRCDKGEDPACVKHCQSICMKYGTIGELSAELENTSKSVLFAP